MTPLELNVLLHYHGSTSPFRPMSEMAEEAVRMFVEEGLLERDDRLWRTTPRGKFYIRALLDTPLASCSSPACTMPTGWRFTRGMWWNITGKKGTTPGSGALLFRGALRMGRGCWRIPPAAGGSVLRMGQQPSTTTASSATATKTPNCSKR